MATRTMKGRPTRTTAGNVGDIYIDTITGKKYKCTFAYRSNDADGEYTWKEISNDKTETKQPEVKPVVKPEPKKVEKVKVEEEPVVEAEAEVEEAPKPKRTNYNKQYNKSNKN